MSYRRDVETLLGTECMTELLNHVRGGKMSDDQIKWFVEHLGELSKTDPEAPNVLLGSHKRRMSRDKDKEQDSELLDVLSDWWKNHMYDETHERAIAILVEALSHSNVKCKDLASKLSPVPEKVGLII